MATVRLRIVNGQSLRGDTPFIGDNGNWWIGNTDTGVPATQDLTDLNNSVEDLNNSVEDLNNSVEDLNNSVEDLSDNLRILDGDVVKPSYQELTEAEQAQARANIGAAPAYTFGSDDIEAGSASTEATGTLHFIYEPA